MPAQVFQDSALLSIHTHNAEVQPPSTHLLSRSQSSPSLSSSNCSAQTFNLAPPIKFIRKNRSDLARAASSSNLSNNIIKNNSNLYNIIEKKIDSTKASSVPSNAKSSLPLVSLHAENYDMLFEFLTLNDQ
jgi:hypothetical protein